jgi:tetratricopeptide (TPR) repeat protein
VGGAAMAYVLEARISGPLQDERDWLPLPTALATAIALLAYGAYGLAATLPNQIELLRAGAITDRMTQIDRLHQVLRDRPYFVEARIYLGELLLSVRRLEEAAEQYRQALKTNPQSEEANRRLTQYHLIRASAAYEAQNWPAALDAYQEAIDLARDKEQKASAHNGFAWVLVDKMHTRLTEAERHAETATRLEPESAAIADTLAWIYYYQGRYDEALRQQLKAVRLSERSPPLLRSQDAEIYYHLGAIYEKLGKKVDARKNYSRALRMRPFYPEASDALRRVSEPEEPERFPPPGRSSREQII